MKLQGSKILWISILMVAAGVVYLLTTMHKKVDFVANVKPIINKSCITCHGGVKKQGGFSLLFRDEAMAKTESGIYAIVPGNAAKSEMIRRLTLKDPEERMPYHHDPLTNEEIATLKAWINQGAEWGTHWSYKPLEPVKPPQQSLLFGLFKKKSKWAENEVDNFIEDKLLAADMQPSPKADKTTLLRRVSLDLIGMPAPERLAKRYLSDETPLAYGKLVDSLLALPQFGEKWASFWLDIARYADTKGYERDDGRNIWEYRDWVIRAFNKDMPYNQFVTEQIAGDLLPNPTYDNYLASAFHRNSMTNDEGGTNNEEFRTAAVLDRVNSTWQGLLGTSFACVQCHSHPYDPFKHDEYYQFAAFFNNSRDEDTQADYPLLRKLDDTLTTELKQLTAWLSANAGQQQAKEAETFIKTWQPAYNSLVTDSFTNAELVDTKWLGMRNKGTCRLKGVWLQNRDELLYRYQAWTAGGHLTIHLDSVKGPLLANITLKPIKGDWDIASIGLAPAKGRHDLFFTYTHPSLKTPEQTGAMFDWFYFTGKFPGKDKPGYADMAKLYWKLVTAKTSGTPIMMDNPDYMYRASHVFERGNWRVKGKEVTPNTPASLIAMPANAPKNRLGLAMWLTAKQNPLTARTMVNHVWEQLFGIGLAETLEDLGSQGIPPTHRELLDWLSYNFINADNWSTKKLIRKIVTSATYQQSSALNAQLLKKDPNNQLYCRFPRVRLSAEQIRDQALCISGLINQKMYGPGVYPYQPDGIWLSPWSGETWKQNKDSNQFRRAIYTFWKRSAGYPSMMAFDAVSREVCTVRRIRTNTPLQALTTLNDSAYIDIARRFARRLKAEAPAKADKQIALGYSLATNHTIDNRSLKALMNLYNVAVKKFGADTGKTERMLADTAIANKDLAALTVVANAILNLDEVVMKN
jgi:mono/diheme cytochrome c family protein